MLNNCYKQSRENEMKILQISK